MNLANKITLMRIAVVPFVVFFLLTDFVMYSKYIAIGLFVLAATTDALDGYIARSRNMITNFGKFMDPVADKLLVCSTLVVLAELGIISSVIVIIILARDIIISAFRMIASARGKIIAADKWGKVKTVLQVIMCVYLMIGFTDIAFVIAGQGLVLIVAVLTVASAVICIYQNKSVLDEVS